MKQWYKKVDAERIKRRKMMYNSNNNLLDCFECYGDMLGLWFYPQIGNEYEESTTSIYECKNCVEVAFYEEDIKDIAEWEGD